MRAGPALLRQQGRSGDWTPRTPGTPARPLASSRVIMLAGRAEAARLCRSPLVMASLVIFAALVWWNSRTAVPQWWVWDVRIGSTMLAVSAAVLVAAHLAAGRARRDGAESLYASYPASATARTCGHLLGLTGPLLLALVLTGGAAVWLDLLGPVGAPRLAVLAQGLLLVALGGATGVALGGWLPHPMTGLLTVIVLGAVETDLVLPWAAPVQPSGGTAWLFPWTERVVSQFTPGPAPAIPPAAHLPWLAALTGLAVIAALCRFVRRPRLTPLTGLAAIGTAACVAVAGWSGWAETRPPAPAALDRLLSQVIHPGQAQKCTSQERVTYCAYPGYQADVARWAAVVNGVLGALPARPSRPLVIRQVADVNPFTFWPYTGKTSPQLLYLTGRGGKAEAFMIAEGSDPGLVPRSSVPPVYVDLNWGRARALGPYQFALALQVARWAAWLPNTLQRTVHWQNYFQVGQYVVPQAPPECVPVGQAREAIALWLAASATPGTRAPLLDAFHYPQLSKVRGRWVSGYYLAKVSGYVPPTLSVTGQGLVLARAMLQLPDRRVEAALASGWPGWLSPRATDRQLARALGIPLPVPPPAAKWMELPGQPANPVCR